MCHQIAIHHSWASAKNFHHGWQSYKLRMSYLNNPSWWKNLVAPTEFTSSALKIRSCLYICCCNSCLVTNWSRFKAVNCVSCGTATLKFLCTEPGLSVTKIWLPCYGFYCNYCGTLYGLQLVTAPHRLSLVFFINCWSNCRMRIPARISLINTF